MSMPPYINKPPATYIDPTHPRTLTVSFLTFHSHFSRNPLSLRDLVMAPAFFNGIDMLSSPIFYLYSFDLYLYSFSLHSTFIYILIPCIRSIFNYVATFYLEEFFVHIFYVHIFLAFYRSCGMNNGPPPPQELGFHPCDEPFAPNVAIPRFPVPAII